MSGKPSSFGETASRSAEGGGAGGGEGFGLPGVAGGGCLGGEDRSQGGRLVREKGAGDWSCFGCAVGGRFQGDGRGTEVEGDLAGAGDRLLRQVRGRGELDVAGFWQRRRGDCERQGDRGALVALTRGQIKCETAADAVCGGRHQLGGDGMGKNERRGEGMEFQPGPDLHRRGYCGGSGEGDLLGASGSGERAVEDDVLADLLLTG